ncbi:hypothetical protein QUA54_17985 [Microcoleus sp. MOSTC5]|uniref:hypothetical protein n=1 Tax=Microcoleus sp. MOSTC5 TaxID=3055378 RepID=UPI002FCEF7BE
MAEYSTAQATLPDYRLLLGFLTVFLTLANNASSFFASLVHLEQNSRARAKNPVSPLIIRFSTPYSRRNPVFWGKRVRFNFLLFNL